MAIRPTVRTVTVVFIAGAILAGISCAQPVVLPSVGCSHAPGEHEDLEKHEIEVLDFERVRRVFWVQLPSPRPVGPAAMAPAPLLLSLHGQTGEARGHGLSHKFNTLGAPWRLISVFPQGMGDASGEEDQGTGWNVGSAGIAGNATCIPEGVGDSGGCYDSCRKLGRCGRCNWTTCYDDVLFIRTLLEKVGQDFCVDLNRIYAHGESNGGMMVNHLVREMPQAFAGVSPWFGSPLLGSLLGPEMQLIRSRADAARTALLTLHARSDVTVPPGGGVSDGGWIFESESSVRSMWAAFHGCQIAHDVIPTKWDGGDLNFTCIEHRACMTGRRVIGCQYRGQHGDWPSCDHGDRIMLWFLFQFSRGHATSRQGELAL